MKLKFIGMTGALALCLVAAGCGSSLEGSYASSSNTLLLELRSGGKAAFTMMGEQQQCTYTSAEKAVHVTCGQDQFDFRINDDGSLISTQSFIAATYGALRKTKQ